VGILKGDDATPALVKECIRTLGRLADADRRQTEGQGGARSKMPPTLL